MKNHIFIIFMILTGYQLGYGQTPSDIAAEGLDFPEGPAWDGRANIFVSNCYSNWITRISDTGCDTFVVKPTAPFDFGKTNGLVYHRDGGLYACDYGKGAIVRFSDSGACELVSAGYKGQKFNRPNDLAFDNKGRLYFTDPNKYDPGNRDGAVYVLDPQTGIVRQVYGRLAFPNGIAFSADGKMIYISESALNRVLQFPVEEDGSLGPYTVFAELPGGDPDGLAFDISGRLYVAHFGSGNVFILERDGSVADTITVNGKKPTNLEFAGNDLRTLYITEAETNAVYRLRVQIPGLKLFGQP